MSSLLPLARQQNTLARPVSVSGFGYFSGREVRVEFRPAFEGAGITFVRSDLGSSARIPASASARIDIPRRTVLVAGDARVEMVEHLLAALAGLQIDNCELWVDAPEMPGVDGSSLPFVEALDKARIVKQNAPVEKIIVDRVLRVGDEENWIEARPAHGAGLSIAFTLDYGPDTAIGKQEYAVDLSPDTFRHKLASCRTFLLEEVAHAMAAQGLGKHVTPQDLLIFNADGPIENELRFSNECVRHKILDVVGDLALTGSQVVADIVAYRSGHQLHAELANQLIALSKSAQKKCA